MRIEDTCIKNNTYITPFHLISVVPSPLGGLEGAKNTKEYGKKRMEND